MLPPPGSTQPPPDANPTAAVDRAGVIAALMAVLNKSWDGWTLTIKLERADIASVPNMAATAIVREGFLNADANLTVQGDGQMGVRTSLTL